MSIPSAKPKSGTLEYQRAWHAANREHVKAQRHEWYLANRDKVLADSKIRHVAKMFGLTVEAYQKLMDARSRCSICDDILTKETAVLDHCHITNKVRDVLCRKCNKALGLMKDNADQLRRAADYLEKHGRQD